MSSRASSKFLCLLSLFAGLALSVACPDDDYHDDDGVPQALPAGTRSASLVIRAVVPEGSWKLRVGSNGQWEVTNREPAENIEELESACITTCASRSYLLHCPGGKCSFSFEVDGMSSERELLLGARFELSDEVDPEGCGPAPDYVSSEDYKRLFELTYEVRDLVLAPDAGNSFHDAGAGGFDAATGPVRDVRFDKNVGLPDDASFGGDGALDEDPGNSLNLLEP